MITGRQERGRDEQFGKFTELFHVLGERAGGVAVGLGLPATGCVLVGRSTGLLTGADVFANDTAAATA
jgi:hypothetical protein